MDSYIIVKREGYQNEALSYRTAYPCLDYAAAVVTMRVLVERAQERMLTLEHATATSATLHHPPGEVGRCWVEQYDTYYLAPLPPQP